MGNSQVHGSQGGATNKISKARSKVVTPILKKLTYSEKGSLDLDRAWDEQQQDGGRGGVAGLYEPAAKSVKDVSFSLGTAGARGSSGGRSALSGKESVVTNGSSGGGNVVRKAYHQHGRSPSGASVATNGSGGGMRAASFVHPFQQIPRTSTPPLSYANSLASFDNSNAPRDYSPTITENEDDDPDTPNQNHLNLATPGNINLNLSHHHTHHSSFSSNHQPTLSTHSSTFSQPALRRPSLASQRTSSLTDITSAFTSTPPLRVTTNGRSTPSTSRLAPSKSDLHLNQTVSELESPVGSIGGTPVPVSAATASTLASPTSSATPLSPLRTSLEAMGIPRIRARSEVDTAVRQQHIRQARRKFEERERAKQDKYDREHVDRRNRQVTKEASRFEKETREWYRATGVSAGGFAAGSSSVNASSVNLSAMNLSESVLQSPPACATKPGRPSASRMTTPTSIAASASVPATGPAGRSVGAGVFGGKRKGGSGLAGSAAGSRSDVFAAGGRASNGSGSASASRKNSGFGRERHANPSDAEKGIAAYASNYDTLPGQPLPRFGASIDDVDGYNWRKNTPRRGSNAKKKTQTAWQGFVLWLRTKIFRLSGH